MPLRPQEPWRSFLNALDAQLDRRVTAPIALHCIGGFVVTMLYGISRSTADIDFLVVGKNPDFRLLQALGGEGSDLHRKFKVYLQPVGVATYPEDYESRLIPIWDELGLRKLRLFGLEAHDLALTKLERNEEVDRQDVQALAAKDLLDPEMLRDRYRAEFRPNLASGTERQDLTVELWVEMIQEVQNAR